jgi:hypothetical protein
MKQRILNNEDCQQTEIENKINALKKQCLTKRDK